MELSKRRSTYPTRSVPNLWAANVLETHQRIRNSQGNLYAEGDTIYSYGPHFPIAMKLPRRRTFQPAALLTTQRYGNTTARHIGMVHTALIREGFTIIHLPPALWMDAVARRKGPIVAYFRTQYAKAVNGALTARTRKAAYRHTDTANVIRRNFINASERLGLKISSRPLPAMIFDLL